MSSDHVCVNRGQMHVTVNLEFMDNPSDGQGAQVVHPVVFCNENGRNSPDWPHTLQPIVYASFVRLRTALPAQCDFPSMRQQCQHQSAISFRIHSMLCQHHQHHRNCAAYAWGTTAALACTSPKGYSARTHLTSHVEQFQVCDEQAIKVAGTNWQAKGAHGGCNQVLECDTRV